jgi:hypothetical protein
MNFKFSVQFLLFFILINPIFSQNRSTLKKDYLWFDEQIGIENTGLFNGLRYEEKYRMENGNHKFYKIFEFVIGDIKYDGQPYYNIKMKYDLLEDQIIVNLFTNTGDNIFKLLSSKLNSFTINDSEFIKLSNTIVNSNEEIKGIFQILFKDPGLILYKKNKKKAKKIIAKDYLYYKFKNDDQYYCYVDEKFYLINSKKDWIKIFPKQKKVIQSFYNSNKILYQSNIDSFSVQLCQKLSNSIAYNTSLN